MVTNPGRWVRALVRPRAVDPCTHVLGLPGVRVKGSANAFTHAGYPEMNTAIAHLRDVLGDKTYESLARTGETMTTADMVAYAYDQIDQAQAAFKPVSK
jgi:hypothetical protein